MKKTISVFLIVIMIFSNIAFAESFIKIDNVTVDNADTLTIEGATSLSSSEAVSLIILKEGIKIPTSDISKVLHIDEVSPVNGRFSFKVPFINPNGIYLILVGGNNIAFESQAQYPYTHYSYSSRLNALKDIQTATSKEDLKTKIAASKEILNLNDPITKLIEGDFVYQRVFNSLSTIPQNDYLAFRQMFLEQSLIEATYQGKIPMLEDYNYINDISKLTTNEIYEKLKKSDKTQIALTLKNKDIKTITALNAKIQENTVFTGIKSSQNLSIVTTYINTYNDVLKISYDVLNKYNKTLNATYQAKANEQIISLAKNALDKGIEITEFQNSFGKIVVECLNNQSKPITPPPSGGGGGGGGGGSPTIPKEDFEVIPTAKPQPTKEPSAFSDLNDVPWAIESINALFSKNIISGKTESTFEPNSNILREGFIKLLVLTFDLTDNNAQSSFIDVDKTMWYYPYISSAYNLKIALGNPDFSFGIGKEITRQEMMVLCYRAAESKKINLEKKRDFMEFTDKAEIDDYAYEAISKMYEAEIINGVDNNTFAPKSPATRAMAAKILYEFINGEEQ